MIIDGAFKQKSATGKSPGQHQRTFERERERERERRIKCMEGLYNISLIYKLDTRVDSKQ